MGCHFKVEMEMESTRLAAAHIIKYISSGTKWNVETIAVASTNISRTNGLLHG